MGTRNRILTAVLFIASLSGCITQEKCLERFPPSSTEIIREFYRDSVIQGSTIRDTIRLLDTISNTHTIVRNHWYYKTDTSGRVELRYMIDQYGNLIADCRSKDHTIQLLHREIEKKSEHIVNDSGSGLLVAIIVLSCFIVYLLIILFHLKKK